MGARLRSWWQQIKQHLVTILVGAIILVVAIALIIVGYRFDWTGFNGNNKSGKTLWDWLQLLIIPVVLAVGGFWLNQIQKSREEKATEQRAKIEREAAEKRVEAEREAAEKHAQTEREIALDNQREAALQAYIDNMSELLLEKNLRKSGKDDEVRTIARVRTLTVLPRLDGRRKRSVLQFLHESSLISKGQQIVNLGGADFYRIDLKNANFSEADLSEADLSEADLMNANLCGANLSKTRLNGADLMNANLSRTNLSGAWLHGPIKRSPERGDLSEANLSEADIIEINLSVASLMNANLSGADLSGAWLVGNSLMNADLSGAILKGTHVTDEQLAKAKSLRGATMTDGSKHT